MLMSSVIPLKFPRLTTLFLAWAWAIISFGVEINAFVKSNRDKNNIKNSVPSPTVITLNTNDVFHAGIVVTVVSALIALLCTLYLALLLVDSSRRSGISTRTLSLQYLTLGFLAIWLLAAQIPVTLFYATRSVQVSASIGGIQVGSSIVKTIENALGAKTAYKDYDYLKLIAILPWFAFLFTLLAAIVSFLASTHARRQVSTKTEGVSSTGKIDATQEPPQPV
ncbi:hypothetical protein B0H11DRAFT_1880580 [Mycena galericulata]|nr:hypothetical protein B0H11DRAFT_1880580 [Mycena galericulata]